MQFLILSKSRSDGIAQWWRPDGRGYTTNTEEAGRFSADEATKIVRGSPEKDCKVPVAAIGGRVRTRTIVDLGDAHNRTVLSEFYEA